MQNSKRTKFADLLKNQSLLHLSEASNTKQDDYSNISLYEKLPSCIKRIISKPQFEAYLEQKEDELAPIRRFLQQRPANDIIFWARPAVPKYVGRCIKVLSIDPLNETMSIGMEDQRESLTIGYGWIEEQAKQNKPVKVDSRFFKEPTFYVKSIKPYLYSIQDDVDYPILYKFILIENKLN